MAISASALQAKLEAWGKTSAGKQQIKDFTTNAAKTGVKLSNGSEIAGEKTMEALAQQLIVTVQRWLPNSITQTGMHSSPVRKNPDGSFSVDIYFNQEDLQRDSLYPEGESTRFGSYDNGIENIVALLNNGMEAEHSVYGWWEGHNALGRVSEQSASNKLYFGTSAKVPSRKFRHPLWFMQDAVFEFESEYGQKYNLKVRLSDDYTDNHHWK